MSGDAKQFMMDLFPETGGKLYLGIIPDNFGKEWDVTVFACEGSALLYSKRMIEKEPDRVSETEATAIIMAIIAFILFVATGGACQPAPA